MNEQLRQQITTQMLLRSLEGGVEQLLNEKSALERALAEALQNSAQNPVQNIQAPPPRKFHAKRRTKAALCQARVRKKKVYQSQ